MRTKATETILNILIFFALLVLIFVVGYPQYKEAKPAQIRIGVDKSFCGLPFYVAKFDTSRKYFDIERVAPELVEITEDPLEGLRNNKYDIVALPWYVLLRSPEINGDTIKALASISLKAISDAIIIPQGTKIKSLKDLNNKRIGCLKEDEYIFDLLLPELVFEKLTKVNKVILRPEDIQTALIENKVDALYLLEPYRSYMLFQGDTMVGEGYVFRYLQTTMPYSAIVMRKSFLREKPTAAVRIKNALDGVLGFLKAHPEVGKAVLLKINNWSSDEVLFSNIRIPEYERLVEIDFKSLENYQSLLQRKGIEIISVKPEEICFKKTDFKH